MLMRNDKGRWPGPHVGGTERAVEKLLIRTWGVERRTQGRLRPVPHSKLCLVRPHLRTRTRADLASAIGHPL